MAAARLKRSRGRSGEQAQVLGGVGLLCLVAMAGIFAFDAAAFVSVGTVPLTSASRTSSTPSFTAPVPTVQASVSSQTLAACVVIAAAAAARAAFASRQAGSRKASARSVVRCANICTASPAAAPAFDAPQQARFAPVSPLLDLGEPQVVHLPAKELLSMTTPAVTCQVSTSVFVSVAAAASSADAHAGTASDAAPAAGMGFAGARAARVIGGSRYSSSRKQNSRSGKRIRCYVAQQFPDVVPLELAYDPSRLALKMQAGLQATSRMRKLYSREQKGSPACRTAVSCTGVSFQAIYLSAKDLDDIYIKSFDMWLT
eukprot:TRINITY_DN39458_c0_g1_i1.p1 TRINITY_DN39458_c0_g1~~TRINITY_DN39458_c0_g1_i1.p1  ORF type:complete len:315 (+),score=60.47 TRINITY_DN39458_c0_g1_i1:82-1026(+)